MRCMRVTFDGSRCVAQAAPLSKYCRQHRLDAPRDMPGVRGPDRTGSVVILESPGPAGPTRDRPEEVKATITIEGFVSIGKARCSRAVVLEVRDPAVTGVLSKAGAGIHVDLTGATPVGIRLRGLGTVRGSGTGRLHARAFGKHRSPAGRKTGPL